MAASSTAASELPSAVDSAEVDGDGSAGGPQIGDLLSMGVTLAGCLVVGFGLGWLVDLGTRTFPVFALVGLALGIAAACWYFYRQFKRYL